MQRIIFLVCLFLLILGLDQASKLWVYYHQTAFGAAQSMYPYGGVGVFSDFLGIHCSLNYVTNTGAAWGVFSHFRWTLFAVRCLLIIALVVFLFVFNRDKALQVPLVLILSGAVGNIIDVLAHGFVIDMVKVVLWGYEYPVFNMADSAVTLGIFWWALYSLFSKPKQVA